MVKRAANRRARPIGSANAHQFVNDMGWETPATGALGAIGPRDVLRCLPGLRCRMVDGGRRARQAGWTGEACDRTNDD